jgi:hypothetical protein
MTPGWRTLAGAAHVSCRGVRVILVAAICLLPVIASAQDTIITAVRAAMAPALQFPATDDGGALPVGNNTDALWMVVPTHPDDSTIEVLANPLNEINQVRAARAMAQIEASVEAAQRRATAQYVRAVAEAQRTGKSQPVDGVTLADEGVAGAKIDAESHVTIDVRSNQGAYRFEVESSIPPAPSTSVTMPAGVAVIAVASNTYHDDALGADRYVEGQTWVFLGRVTPQVFKGAGHSYEVGAIATAPSSIVIKMRGNEALIADLLRKTNWNSLLELIK